MRRTHLALLLAAAGCRQVPDKGGASADTLVVFTAASLSAPMREVLDSFAARESVTVQEEHGASLELARRITALGRVPDVIALADAEVFPELLVPRAASWYAAFARNRMVVAFTDRSRAAGEITSSNWYVVLQRSDITLGRSDPAIAPVGYRALLTYALAETHYQQPGLAKRLELRTPPSHLRANATELAALLQAGELDYIVDYESLAKAHGFRYVTLPPDVDLGDPTHATVYATAHVRVARLTDTTERHGAPIVYALSIPRAARHAEPAARFIRYLFSADGATIMRRRAIDMLAQPIITGDSAPLLVSAHE